MRIHILIHASFEKAGAIESWAIKNSHTLSFTHTYKGEQLPDVSQFDFLVLMGGPQSCATELCKYSYLQNEVALTKLAISQNKIVLGICLGAQIIGESLGAKAEHSPNKEIGIFPIQLTDAGRNDIIFKNIPSSFDVMHWHNDMPGMTADSVILAHSEGCPRQIIKYTERVYGIQCHMELTTELIRGMTAHCADELNPGKYIQNTEKMLSADMSEINEKMIMILDQLATLANKTANEQVA